MGKLFRKSCTDGSVNKVVNLFSLLLDPHEDDKILAEGVARFCEDLKLDPASRTVLVLAWKFRAATQCEFTKKEFLDGMAEAGYVISMMFRHIIIHTHIVNVLHGYDSVLRNLVL